MRCLNDQALSRELRDFSLTVIKPDRHPTLVTAKPVTVDDVVVVRKVIELVPHWPAWQLLHTSRSKWTMGLTAAPVDLPENSPVVVDTWQYDKGYDEKETMRQATTALIPSSLGREQLPG